MQRTCANCKHCTEDRYDNAICTAIRNCNEFLKNTVGLIHFPSGLLCSDMRRDGACCGPSGRLFVPIGFWSRLSRFFHGR